MHDILLITSINFSKSEEEQKIMKKNVIALLLAVVMASGSLGTVPALAAEPTAQEAVPFDEEASDETEEVSSETNDAEDASAVEDETDTAEDTAVEMEEIPDDLAEGESEERNEESSAQDSAEAAEKNEEDTAEEADMTAEENISADTADEATEATEATEAADPDEPAAATEEATAEIEGKEAALADGEDVVASGSCGSYAKWTLTGTGYDLTLTISGSGAMRNYEESTSPWYSCSDYGSKIKTIIIENGITTIGAYAFYGCDVNNVTISDSVTKIYNEAFSKCNSLTTITIPDSVTYLGTRVFFDSALVNITIPGSVKNLGAELFLACYFMTDVTISDGVTSIGEGTFCDCTGLTDITLPDSVKSIGEDAFANTKRLNRIVIPAGVTSIANSAFNHSSAKLTIFCEKGSYAEEFAKKKGIKYKYYCRTHSWNTSYTVDKEATCTEEGSESIHCSVCDVIDESTIRTIPMKEHSYGGWTVTKEVTCTEDGSREKTCVDCGYTVTENILATGHAWEDEYTTDKEATCTEEGSESIHCSKCDTIDESTIRAIPAAHKWNATYTIDKEPTYTEEGLESIHCSVCDEIREGTQRPVAVLPKPVSMLTISGITAKTYNGKAQTQTVTVKDGDTTLTAGTDYTVSYKNNTNAGTASVIITGIGKYADSVTKTFTIKKIANTITAKSIVKSYSAQVQTFDLGAKVKYGTPTYKSDNKAVTVSKAGKVTVKAKFIGNANITITSPANTNYTSAKKTIVIKVMPTKTKFTSAANVATRKMKLTWVKRSNATGYIIQYSTSSTFAGAKTARIDNYTTVSTTIDNLVKNKKYYVRIKTFKTVSGTKYYSGWSDVMSVTIRK